ncbi:MAG: tRNA (N6-isopentenyl adenosine(37)-C2)-methylthiotransferase MiaB [Eubacterium sp.]|nr:tRNA (N6-isopentenyl adenosine(37)-C2)-methylthiotransferase MiaB [Eubacterium sp.]
MIRELSGDEVALFGEYIDKTRAFFLSTNVRPKAYVHSYGCQQNVSDGEKIKGMLAEMGYDFTDTPDNVDLILLNTCAVRENAEDKVFGNIGAFKKLKESNRRLIIAVGGCMVQQQHIAEKLKASYPMVDIIFGTHTVHELPRMLYDKLTKNLGCVNIPDGDGVLTESIPVRRDNAIKAYVPIMYGCNNFCTYCVVPYVRGRERSRKADAVVSEVKELIQQGYKEILLLGQNVNSYGKEHGIGFAELLRRLDAIEGEYKISFMTSHPKDCTRELIDVIADSAHIEHHIHLPVQSGSDRILKAMNRSYTTEHYLGLVEYAKSRIPDLSLTTDIIVGFPGETYEDFRQTVKLMETVRYDMAYTFIYSKREGTKAADMDDPVSDKEKGLWMRELLEVQGDIGLENYRKYIGKILDVLCEGRDKNKPEYLTGHSRQNIIVRFAGGDELVGSFVKVKITKAMPWAVEGETVGDTD